ncbi:hypothetical protein ACJMK2_035251 [Sinanodonta woodiana]|uniref:Cadherin-related family member 1 n=1 Tax=Sinanodonta woodiana TaxID=1069815 RepID=A0ABD3WUA2_SINWO
MYSVYFFLIPVLFSHAGLHISQVKLYSEHQTENYMAYWIVIGITGLLFAGCAGRPQFDYEPQYHQMYENVTEGTFLFELKATDTNNPQNPVTISTFNAQASMYVTVNQTNTTTANIYLKVKIDREEHEDGIELQFYAHDTLGNSDLKSIRLFLLDVCDSSPKFIGQPYVFEVNETNVNGSIAVYMEIKAEDKDNGDNAVVTYIMKPKTESVYWKDIYNKTFRINPVNGTVFLERSLDYEENSFYQFIIEAHDRCNLNATADLTIRIKDVQDQPPFFEGLPYMASLNEGNYSHHNLLQVKALDGDRGVPNNVRYLIVKDSKCSKNDIGNCFCEDLFTINNVTGDITLSGNLDWGEEVVKNTFGICTITIKAKEDDMYPSTRNGATESNTTVTLTIIDINNNPPQFANKFYNASVQENAATNTPLLLQGGDSIRVLDKDQGSNSKFNITLKCDNNTDCEMFDVVPNMIFKEGVLTIRVNNNSRLDYEHIQSITILVIAREELNNIHTDTATVVVTIENVNEYSPKFDNETYEAWIQEGAENGTFVINVTATDGDRDESSKISYTLSGANTSFAVDKTTGQVVTNCTPKDLDREHQEDIYLRITATDEGGRMSQAQLIIHLLDVNDNAPTFQQTRYTAILDENSTTFINESFLIVKATDKDAGNNSMVLYEIEYISTFCKNFTIDNETGEMRLSSTLDYEAIDDLSNGVINLTVYAYNYGAHNVSGNVTVTIVVQDVNDNAPQFNKNGYLGSINETAVEGTLVVQINATDGDKTARNKQISFAVARFDYFQINSSTGVVSVQTGAHFDSDKVSSYNLTIFAIDQGANPYTSTTTLSVTIEDVNNKPPEFINVHCIDDVREDSIIRSLMVTCGATDPDKNASLRYTIRTINGWDKNNQTVQDAIVQRYIGIIETTGTLYVNSTLDRETVATLELSILVNDTGAKFNEPQNATGECNYITDDDSENNAINKWKFEMFTLQMTPDLEKRLNGQPKQDRCSNPVCVTQNGTIVNNMYYAEDMSGFFNVTVLVKDDAGNDTAYCLIFLIADSQVLKMVLQGIRANVARIKDDILSDCTNVTGLLFVYDSIMDHKSVDGTVDTMKTDLFFHIQDHENNKVLSADEAKRLLDAHADSLYYARMKHGIVSIESEPPSANTETESRKTIYVLAAVISLLTLVVLIVGYMFFSSSERYKRKLRAAMPPEKEVKRTTKDDFVLPGSNVYAHKENPLLNVSHAPPVYKEIDTMSENSLDKNDVDDAEISPRDRLEEKEVTLDMYGDDYFTQIVADDPLEAALREHEAQKQANMQKPDDSRVGYGKSHDDSDVIVNGFVNDGFRHNLELETSDI